MKRIAIFVLALVALVAPAFAGDWESTVTPEKKLQVYIGGHGAIANADLGFGAPINIGSNGQMIGGRLGADLTLGQFFVGAFVDADKVFGDLESLGVDWDASVNGRVGAQLGSAKLYLHVGYGRTFGNGDHLDYLQFGPGAELDLGSNWSARLEYARREYSDVPGGFDLTADIVKGGLNYRF